MSNKWLKSLINILIVVIIVSISVTCLISMLLCINTFIENQKAFNASYTEATTSLVNFIDEYGGSENSITDATLDSLDNALTYLENLQLIQKNSTTNDIMSFLYSLLSTILVGLCAGFVAKSKKHADEAEKIALSAKKNAEEAKTAKESAERIRNETQQNVESAEKLEETALNQINIHNDNIKILSIHIEIMYAHYFLDAYDQVQANKRIYVINKRVCALNDNLDKSSIEQLRNELLTLNSTVDRFHGYADNCTNINRKISLQQSASRYTKQIKEAISICDNIIRQ